MATKKRNKLTQLPAETRKVDKLEQQVIELQGLLEEAQRNTAYEQGRRKEAQEQLSKQEESRKEDFRFMDRQRDKWMEEIFFLRRFILLLTVDKEKSDEIAKMVEEMRGRGY